MDLLCGPGDGTGSLDAKLAAAVKSFWTERAATSFCETVKGQPSQKDHGLHLQRIDGWDFLNSLSNLVLLSGRTELVNANRIPNLLRILFHLRWR